MKILRSPDEILSLCDNDQMTVFAFTDQLKLHAANLRGILSAEKGKLVAPPQLSKDGTDFLTNVTTLTEHIHSLEQSIGSGCPKFKFAAHPLAATAARQPGLPPTDQHRGGDLLAGASSADMTLTEKILAAKGVRSIDQLNKLCAGYAVDEKKDDKKNNSDNDEDDDDDENDDEGDDGKNPNKDGHKPSDQDKEQKDRNDREAKTRRKLNNEPASNMTGLILKARGVKTIAELNTLCEAERNQQPPRHVSGD